MASTVTTQYYIRADTTKDFGHNAKAPSNKVTTMPAIMMKSHLGRGVRGVKGVRRGISRLPSDYASQSSQRSYQRQLPPSPSPSDAVSSIGSEQHLQNPRLPDNTSSVFSTTSLSPSFKPEELGTTKEKEDSWGYFVDL